MTTLTQTHFPDSVRNAFNKKRDQFIERLIPRPCMVGSVCLILAGLSLPFLMVIEILQPGLLLGFLGLVLFVTGGILVLFYYGEI